jgi:DNA polymerase-3 subunit beta
MKIIVARAAILPALEACARLAPARSLIPILRHVHLAADADGLSLRACDLDREMIFRLPAGEDIRVEARGETTIGAHVLRDGVKRLREGAELALTAEGGAARLTSGRAKINFDALPAEDMPRLSALEHDVVALDLAGDVLARLMSYPAMSISADESRFYLNGIFLHSRAGRLSAVATDGHRLTLYEPQDISEVDWRDVIVPAAACGPIAGLARGEEAVRVETNGRLLRVGLADGTVLTTKLIDGTFPDYQRVIPHDPPLVARLARADAIKALGVARLAQGENRGGRLEFAAGALTISAAGQDVGVSASDQIEAEDAREFVCGFNMDYLDAIWGLLEGERLTLAMASPGDPGIWRSDGRPDVTCVLMPIRT